jgi:hypothetical protein
LNDAMRLKNDRSYDRARLDRDDAHPARS